jgi:hypothetical protein
MKKFEIECEEEVATHNVDSVAENGFPFVVATKPIGSGELIGRDYLSQMSMIAATTGREPKLFAKQGGEVLNNYRINKPLLLLHNLDINELTFAYVDPDHASSYTRANGNRRTLCPSFEKNCLTYYPTVITFKSKCKFDLKTTDMWAIATASNVRQLPIQPKMTKADLAQLIIEFQGFVQRGQAYDVIAILNIYPKFKRQIVNAKNELQQNSLHIAIQAMTPDQKPDEILLRLLNANVKVYEKLPDEKTVATCPIANYLKKITQHQVVPNKINIDYQSAKQSKDVLIRLIHAALIQNPNHNANIVHYLKNKLNLEVKIIGNQSTPWKFFVPAAIASATVAMGLAFAAMR